MPQQQNERVTREGSNADLFRTVNAQLVRLNETFEPLAGTSSFVCECGDLSCVEQIDMPLSDYHRIRSHPRWFFVAPSDAHVLDGEDRVVEVNRNYYVVEKSGPSAASAATMTGAAA